MKRKINDNVRLPQLLTLLNDVGKVEIIDYSADFNDMLNNLDKLQALYTNVSMDFDLIRYILRMSKTSQEGQSQRHFILMQRKYTDTIDREKMSLKFDIVLTTNQSTNFNSMHICLPKNLKRMMRTIYQPVQQL